MVAAANGAQGCLKRMLWQQFIDTALPAFIQRQINIAQLPRQFFRLGLVCGQIGLPKGHAAADIVAD